MRLIRPDNTTVNTGERLTHTPTGAQWTYLRPGVPPDPDRDPPFVGRIIMEDDTGDEQEFYPQEFHLNYVSD